MTNTFENDKAHISTAWLLRLVTGRGLKVQHVLKVIHLGGTSVHYIALLSDHRYVCTCCMGLNLGIPCRHYFQVLTTVKSLRFHIGLLRARYVPHMYHINSTLNSLQTRWYQDPSLDISQIPAVALEDTTHNPSQIPMRSKPLPTAFSNPLNQQTCTRTTPPTPTQTVGSRFVFQEAQSALRPLLSGVQTQEQLDTLVDRLDAIR